MAMKFYVGVALLTAVYLLCFLLFVYLVGFVRY